MKSEQQILTELALGEFHFDGGRPWQKGRKLTLDEMYKLADCLVREPAFRDANFPKDFDTDLGQAVYLLLEFLGFDKNGFNMRYMLKFESLEEMAIFLDAKAVSMTSQAAVSALVGRHRKYAKSKFGLPNPTAFGTVKAFEELTFEDPGAGADRVGE